MKSIRVGSSAARWMTAAAAIMGGILLVASPVQAQRDRRDSRRNDDNRASSRSNDSRSSSRSKKDDSRARFTRSDEGRTFNRGVELRHSVPITDQKIGKYFTHKTYSFPHYVASGIGIKAFVSPYGFYLGVMPPFIDSRYVVIAPPAFAFIDVPIYSNGVYVVETPVSNDYYLYRNSEDDKWRSDPDLKRAVNDMEDAFQNDDIALLANYVDSGTKIAVFAKGKYEYSLDANDYLDMTRDFMKNAQTTSFNVYKVHNRTSDVYQAFAKHIYKDEDGKSHTVFVCAVLERVSGQWTITQIDSSPGRLN